MGFSALQHLVESGFTYALAESYRFRREAANPEMELLAMTLASDKKPSVAERAKFYLDNRNSAAAIN